MKFWQRLELFKAFRFENQLAKIIKECLEAAIQSPTGSNAQSWQWLVVTDPEQRTALADLYKDGISTRNGGECSNCLQGR